MSLLRSIESRIARLVEGGFSRVFKSNVQPVEIARRLVKEMDDHRQRTVQQVYVPNEYAVYLSPADYDSFAGVRAAITTELGEYLAEYARRAGYAMLSRPRVLLHKDADLSHGVFGIASSTTDAPNVSPPVDAPANMTMVQPVATPAPAAVTPATLVLVTAGATVQLGVDRVRIGRGRSNDLVVDDSSVSREHAEVTLSPTGWLLRDLDSTNGVVVNGARVREHRLAAGDRVLLGSAELRVDQA